MARPAAKSGTDFRSSQIIAGYFADFYCYSHALVVEVDGAIHEHQRGYDRVRREAFAKLGIRTIRVKNRDVRDDLASSPPFLEGKGEQNQKSTLSSREKLIQMADEAKPLVLLLYPELQDQAAVALGRAFINDPTFRAIVPRMPDAAARASVLGELFRAMFVLERRTGQPAFGVVCDGKVVAAAVTEGAGRASMADTVMAGMGQMPRLIRAIGVDGIYRAMAIFRVLAQSHPTEPHLYLQALGVDPDYQRRHLGIALLDYLRDQAAARADVSGVYLETATEVNVAYYSAKGYQVIGEISPLGVRMWRMFQRVR